MGLERSNKHLLLACLAAFALPLHVAAQSGPPTVHHASPHEELEFSLDVGEQEVLPAQGVRSYSEGAKGVIDVRLTGDAQRFVIVGLKGGVTTLLFLMTDGSERHYRFTVVDPTAQLPAQQTLVNPLAVKPLANVRLDLYFVQIERSYSHNIGMNVPATVGTATFAYAYDIPARQLISNSAIVGTELLPQLELAQAQGWAKLTRHVAVITTNGTQANFSSGGEFNVQVVQGLTASVTSISFGSVLGVVPRYDEESRRVELAVNAEVSDLAATGASIPGRNRSTLTTVVNLALGESLAVAGLTATSDEQQKNGLPGLSQIPVLGLLFGKQGVRQKQTENVVYIVPSVVEPMQKARAKEFMREAMQRFDEFEGEFTSKKLMPTQEATEKK